MSVAIPGSPPSPEFDLNDLVAEGSLTFVGAGPGDPALLTVAGEQALRTADLVAIDSPEQREFLAKLDLPDDLEVIEVDPEDGERLLYAVHDGRDVVRLVPGDLFFDSSTEVLAQALAAPGVRVDVIPGVSAATSVASYTGTRAGEWAFVDAASEVPVTWPHSEALMIRTKGRLLGYVADVIDRPADEPVLVVCHAGSTSQTTERTTWPGLADLDMKGEVFVLAGECVANRSELDWFASKPLFGWRVLIPVAKDQDGVVSARAASYGALPQEVPTMSIEPPRTEQQMEKAIRGLVDGRYKWIVFTTPNAVKGIRARFDGYGLDARSLSGIEVAVVGSGTARALQAWGINPDFMPLGQQTAANLAASFPAFDDLLDPINRVLVPRAEIATDALLAGLEGIGWEVEDVTAYRTVRAAPPPAETREAIKTGLFDAVVFASSSTVRNLIGIAGKPHNNMVVVAIGPETAKTCEDYGLRVDAISAEPTAKSLVDTLAKVAEERRAAQLAKGGPVTKPSQRRRRRRKATV